MGEGTSRCKRPAPAGLIVSGVTLLLIIALGYCGVYAEEPLGSIGDGFRWSDCTVVGYAGNWPKQILGVNAMRIRDGRPGLYLDLKMSFPGKTGGDFYYENISVRMAEGWGDPLRGSGADWMSLKP